LPFVFGEGAAIEFEVRDGGPEGRLAADLDFLGEIAWKFGEKAEDEGDFFAGFDDGVLVVAIELGFRVLDAVIVDLSAVSEIEIDVNSRVSDIFDFDIFAFDVTDRYFKIEL
jgi:hypothetical protein